MRRPPYSGHSTLRSIGEAVIHEGGVSRYET
jgi:hypothetical protein